MTVRQVNTETLELRAECLRCQWSTTAANGQGNAARHHDATGHPVEVHHTRRIVYGDPGVAPQGQTELIGREEAATP